MASRERLGAQISRRLEEKDFGSVEPFECWPLKALELEMRSEPDSRTFSAFFLISAGRKSSSRSSLKASRPIELVAL